MGLKPLGVMMAASCMFHTRMAYADDMPVPGVLFGGNVQFRTNFVARGISQSQGQPSVAGEIDYNSGDGLYGSLDGNSINWIDQAHPGDSVSLNANGWLGYRLHLGSAWVTKMGIHRIQFPGHYVPQSPPVEQPNATEAFGSAAWDGLGAELDYAITDAVSTPGSKGSVYLNVSVSRPLGTSWTLGASLGRAREAGHDPATHLPNSRFDYTDYKLSLACDFGAGVRLTLAHTWTNADPRLFVIDGYAIGGHHTWLQLEKGF